MRFLDENLGPLGNLFIYIGSSTHYMVNHLRRILRLSMHMCRKWVSTANNTYTLLFLYNTTLVPNPSRSRRSNHRRTFLRRLRQDDPLHNNRRRSHPIHRDPSGRLQAHRDRHLSL